MDTPRHLQVDVRIEPRAIVVALTGELGLASAPALDEQFERTLAAGVELVIVDLRAVEFMDSTGLATLIRARQAALESELRFAIVRGGAQIERLFRPTSGNEQFVIVDAPENVILGEVNRSSGV